MINIKSNIYYLFIETTVSILLIAKKRFYIMNTANINEIHENRFFSYHM